MMLRVLPRFSRQLCLPSARVLGGRAAARIGGVGALHRPLAILPVRCAHAAFSDIAESAAPSASPLSKRMGDAPAAAAPQLTEEEAKDFFKKFDHILWCCYDELDAGWISRLCFAAFDVELTLGCVMQNT